MSHAPSSPRHTEPCAVPVITWRCTCTAFAYRATVSPSGCQAQVHYRHSNCCRYARNFLCVPNQHDYRPAKAAFFLSLHDAFMLHGCVHILPKLNNCCARLSYYNSVLIVPIRAHRTAISCVPRPLCQTGGCPPEAI